jgi:uncharacterized protein YgiM (DUF1202 family)
MPVNRCRSKGDIAMIAKRTTAALTVCATASGLILAVLPAGAAARPAGTTGALTMSGTRSGQPALACTYQVTNVRPGAMLNVRSGAGQAYGPVGTLRAGEAPVAGACTSVNGWVQVKTPTGTTGWIPTGNLRKLTSPPAVTGRSALACTYRVTRVRRASFLNVRSGAGLRFRPIGRLRVADGRLPGACTSTKGWTKVKAANGKRGWASAHYLRKVTK